MVMGVVFFTCRDRGAGCCGMVHCGKLYVAAVAWHTMEWPAAILAIRVLTSLGVCQEVGEAVRCKMFCCACASGAPTSQQYIAVKVRNRNAGNVKEICMTPGRACRGHAATCDDWAVSPVRIDAFFAVAGQKISPATA